MNPLPNSWLRISSLVQCGCGVLTGKVKIENIKSVKTASVCFCKISFSLNQAEQLGFVSAKFVCFLLVQYLSYQKLYYLFPIKLIFSNHVHHFSYGNALLLFLKARPLTLISLVNMH